MPSTEVLKIEGTELASAAFPRAVPAPLNTPAPLDRDQFESSQFHPVLETFVLPTDKDSQRARLRCMLTECKIPVDSEWNRDRARSFEDLLREINEGDSQLVHARQTLIRQVRVARVDVYHQPEDGPLLKLYEAFQIIYEDLRKKVRDQTIAIWEKLKPGEDPRTGAIRGLYEELDIPPPTQLFTVRSQTIVEPPRDYPGIPAISEQHDYRAFLPPESFRNEGYVDPQKDKVTVFLWRQCTAEEVTALRREHSFIR